MSATLTASQYREISKPERTGRIPRASKARRTVDGIVFDSLKEAERWKLLRLSQIAGRITNLERQVKYALHVNGELIGHYISDFEYQNETGQLIVEDVKSKHTRNDPLYRWKAKHIRAQYGIEIKEVL